MAFKLIQILLPVTRRFPSVSSPQRYISTGEKTFYTAIILFIYLVCCQIPLYGVRRLKTNDPFYWMRVILASNSGSLMQLGLTPIISAGWILQLLVGTNLIEGDLHSKIGRKSYENSQKVLAMLMVVGQAFTYVWSGYYGPLDQLGKGNIMLVILQLAIAGFLVILLDQMLKKGYGLTSGVSLFIAVNFCQNIMWQALSPVTEKSQYGIQFHGSIIALIHFLLTKKNVVSALYQAFYRTSGANLSNLVVTGLIFLFMIYLHNCHVVLKLVNKKYKGSQENFPIRLFYTSTISVIFQSALVSNLSLILSKLYRQFPDSWWIGVFGVWQNVEGREVPLSGLSYWISPPLQFSTFITEPLHSLVYCVFMMASCAFFSRLWIQISKQSPSDVAKQIKERGLMISGYQESAIFSVLNKYISVAATCGGITIGFISIVSDLIRVPATGILITVSIICNCYEQITGKESKQFSRRQSIY